MAYNDDSRLDCSDIDCSEHNGYKRDSCPECEIQSLQARIQELEGGWIPVSERLPENNDRVLCTMVAEDSVEFVDTSWHDGDDWWEVGLCEVTHWMPLPEPPEVNDG